MNRRDFLKIAGAAALSSQLPALPEAEAAGEWFDINAVRRAATALRKNAQWYCLLHPDFEAALELTPKERWKIAYRTERMRLKGYARELSNTGEMGSFENFRFIVG
jgi:hypothetical protein